MQDLIAERFDVSGARADLIIVHGLAEHRQRYAEAVQRFNAAQLGCTVYDQRGHGESPGSRTHIDRFDQLTDDLAQLVAETKSPERPLFLWGHSMGSGVVSDLMLRHPAQIAGVITTAFSLDAMPGLVLNLSPLLSPVGRVLPNLRVNPGFSPDLISRDETVQIAYASDPLVPKTITVQFAFEFARTLRRIRRQLGNLTAPWLAIHGGDDQIAPARGSQRLFDGLGASDKTLEIIAKARHEVHNELAADRDRVYELMISWLHHRAPKT